ncbi:MAG: DUF2062 domain-containing protein [Thermoanaerobaculia bacterium]
MRTEGSTPGGNALAVGLGVFIGCLPVYGFHLLLCVVLARLFRVSRIKAYLAANLSNPVIAPVLLYLELGVGHWIFAGSWPSLRLESLKAAGVIALGRDLVVGSLVVGAVLAGLFGTVVFHLARRWRGASFAERLREATARKYLESGISHWEFVRGKLRYDPMYREIPGSMALPRDGLLIDVGCGRGILLALLATARELGDTLSPPAAWRPPADRLELAGIELRSELAAVARAALGDAARIESGDAADRQLPPARTILLLDVLHYLPAADQQRLLRRVASALQPGGAVYVREADAGGGWRFFLTRAAERLCAIARGHWRQRFHYRTAGEWCRLLQDLGLAVSQRPMSAGTPYANRLIEARRTAGNDQPADDAR